MKRKPGRPRKPEEERLTQTVSLRLKTEEVEALKRLAQESRKSVSDLVRESLFEKKNDVL